MSRIVSALFVAGMVAAVPASAQSILDSGGGRYQMQPVEGGIARLDTQTGAVELCRIEGEALVCKGSSDGQQRDADRIADLEARVEALEGGKRVLKGADETADQAIKTMRQVFRGFADIVRELERDLGSDPDKTEGGAEPGRT
ncbi:hypothetical protein [Aurantimonas marianensis]|uniref:Uncharacterized protein n=1 Tax=Aurantimonas marianensis TaxID=2920428 RepID=A0A9X2KGA0_9HYPH|nr:hypothetical protein [Aurantimonas marianensis]MCP3053562.1 hypothetical protein [Aurantimonas marianensis]